jgi:hypothetical protein
VSRSAQPGDESNEAAMNSSSNLGISGAAT